MGKPGVRRQLVGQAAGGHGSPGETCQQGGAGWGGEGLGRLAGETLGLGGAKRSWVIVPAPHCFPGTQTVDLLSSCVHGACRAADASVTPDWKAFGLCHFSCYGG